MPQASAVVAGWLTSGLGIAMSRIGWNLLSPRQALTRLPSRTLANYYCYGYPFCREEDRPYHQYGNITYTDDQWDRLCAWLTGDPTFRRKIERRKKELKEKMGGRRDDSDNRTKARAHRPSPRREQLFFCRSSLLPQSASPAASSTLVVAIKQDSTTAGSWSSLLGGSAWLVSI